MSIFNPVSDLSHLGNAIGAVLGNNTYNTSSPLGNPRQFAAPGTIGNPNLLPGQVNPLAGQRGATPTPGVVDLSKAPTGVIPSFQGILGTASAGSGAASSTDPATQAAYDQAIANTQAGINRLDPSLQSGLGSIDTSYRDALNQLLLGRNQAQTSYDQNKQSTAQDYIGAKNTIGSNAGSTLNGLLRLLGSRGAGGGSAYLQAAPGAVARGATLQRADVANQFGANSQALDSGWNNYLTGYNNQVSSASNQRDQQRQSLQGNIDTNRASLLQSLAQLVSQRSNSSASAQPYLDQANALLDKSANYTTPGIDYQTQAYTPPSLTSYTTNPQAAPTLQGQTASNDYYSPYLQSLLGKKQLATG